VEVLFLFLIKVGIGFIGNDDGWMDCGMGMWLFDTCLLDFPGIGVGAWVFYLWYGCLDIECSMYCV